MTLNQEADTTYQMVRPTALLQRVHNDFNAGTRFYENLHNDVKLGKTFSAYTAPRRQTSLKLRFAHAYATTPLILMRACTVRNNKTLF